MKVNREQFLAAALLFATTTGCGKITDKMKESIGATADPAADQGSQIHGTGVGIEPNGNNPVTTQGGATKGTTPVNVNAKQPAPPTPKIASRGPANEGVGPANENIAPAKEGVGPSRENWGPSKENVAPSKENWGPSKENWGPSKEGRGGHGPSNENWPRPSPSGRPAPKPKRG